MPTRGPLMDAWEAIAREAIRDLVARYNVSGDRGRIGEMMTLFSADAVLEVDGKSRSGTGEIEAFFAAVAEATRAAVGANPGAAPGARCLRHFTATHQIDFAGPDQAAGRCYYQVLTESGLDHWGRYLDDYVRVGESWKFRRRIVTVDGYVEGGWCAATRAATTRF